MAGAFAIAVAAGGFLGISGGKVDRLLNNHPWLVFLSVVAIAAAAVIGALAPLLAADKRTKPSVVGALIAGGVLVVLSLGLLELAASKSASDRQRPRITAQLVTTANGMTLKGRVDMGGLMSKHHVLLRVDGTSTTDVLDATRSGHPAASEQPPRATSYQQLLLGSRAGPDADGNVSLPFDIQLTPGLYDRIDIHAQRIESGSRDVPASQCTDKSEKLGCRSIVLPRAPLRPYLSASLTAAATVTAKVAISGVAPDDRVKLTVRRLDRGHLGRASLVQTLSPDPDGNIQGTISSALPPNSSEVCVRAKLIPAGHIAPVISSVRERTSCEGGGHAVVAVLSRGDE